MAAIDDTPAKSAPYVGVAWYKQGGTYEAYLSVNAGCEKLGRWATAEEAAIARDRALMHFGAAHDRLQLAAQSVPLGPAAPDLLRRQARLKYKEKHSASGYFGVARSRTSWTIALIKDDTHHRLGGYRTAEEAAIAYDRLALHVLGSRAVVNFPERISSPASIAQLRGELLSEQAERDQRSSRYRGVCRCDRWVRVPWVARIAVAGRNYDLGFWPHEEAAALAYDRAILFYNRSRRLLNFPERASELEPADAKALVREARALLREMMVSRFVGVARQRSGAFMANITFQRECIYLGTHETEEEAAMAYDRAAIASGSALARLNFHPRTGEELCGGYRAPEVLSGDAPTAPGYRQRPKSRTQVLRDPTELKSLGGK